MTKGIIFRSLSFKITLDGCRRFGHCAAGGTAEKQHQPCSDRYSRRGEKSAFSGQRFAPVAARENQLHGTVCPAAKNCEVGRAPPMMKEGRCRWHKGVGRLIKVSAKAKNWQKQQLHGPVFLTRLWLPRCGLRRAHVFGFGELAVKGPNGRAPCAGSRRSQAWPREKVYFARQR